MRLISLKLENFRQHRLSEIAFPDGMIAIVGPNGTGKTTVVEAILFALYGKKRGTRDDLRFLWAGGRQVAKVTLEFELQGRRWTIERRESDATLTLAIPTETGTKHEVIATGINEVKGKVESLVRLTHDQFVNSFCAEQKALAFLADKNAQARQDEIAKMLGYDRLRDAANVARDKQKALEAEAKGLAEALRDEAELLAAQKAASAALVQVQAEGKTLAQERKALAAELEEARRADTRAVAWLGLADKLAEVRSQGRTINELLDSLAKDAKKAEEEVAEYERLAPEAAEFEKLDAHHATLVKLGEAYRARLRAEQDVASRRKALAELESELEKTPAPDVEAAKRAVADATERLSAARAAHRAGLDAWAEAKKEASNAATAARTRYQAAKTHLDKMRDLARQGKCPTCGQAIGADFEEHLQGHASELTMLAELLEKAGAAAKETERPPAELAKAESDERAAGEAFTQAQTAHEEATKRQAARHERVQRIEAERRTLEEAIQSLGDPVAYDEVAYQDCQARLAELRPIRDRWLGFSGAAKRLLQIQEAIRAKKAEFETLRSEADELVTKQREHGFDAKEAAEAARESFRAKDTELRLKDAEIETHRERLTRATEDVQRAKNEIEVNRQRRERHEVLASEAKHFAQTRRELIQLRENLNQELKPQLEYRASENLGLLTGGRYRTLKLDEDFSPTVVEDDDRVKAVISGGEEDVVALSLRLALSELIQERHGMPMTLLILDEVFGSLDAERRQHVMDRLAALKTRFTQMLVISHIEDINQVADRCLYLKRDPASRATVLTDAPPEMSPGAYGIAEA